MTRVDRRADDGQVLLVIIGYALIAAALIVVAVDVSAVILARRALSALADGTAIAAAQAADEPRLYARGAGDVLPLVPDGVRAAAATYLERRDAVINYPGLQLVEASTDGTTVTVTLTEDKPLPFLPLVSALTGAFPGGTVRMTATAHARAPLTSRD